MTNSPTLLDKAVDAIESSIAVGFSVNNFEIQTENLFLILSAAKQLSTLRQNSVAKSVWDETHAKYLEVAAENEDLKTKCALQHQLLHAVFYAAEFYPNDNGYRLKKVLSCTDNGKEVLQELDLRDTLKSALEAMTGDKDVLKECNEQLVVSEQSIRNEANRLRRETGILDRKISELEGKIANALI